MALMNEQQKEFILVSTGDSLIFQKLSIFKEEPFIKTREIIQNSDVAFNNFETIIRNGKGVPRYKIDPTAWMTSPEYVVDELKWMGFNLFSLANNHSMDYGEEALLETIRVFDEKGLTHAGTGRVLSEARSPVYLNTLKGRVALVAINTRGEDGPAGDPRGSIPGRPGVNPLRSDRIITLDSKDFDDLTKISQKLDLAKPQNDRMNFLGLTIEKSQKTDIITSSYKPDKLGNLRAIKEARLNADYVFVSIHNHDKLRPGETYFDDTIEYISTFVEDFSREAIDQGADVIIGHGTHTLNGIEIYKGKPIFYGLGNFISQSYASNPKPYDWYEARGLHEKIYADDSSTITASYDTSSDANERRMRRSSTSVIAKMIFKNKKASSIDLFPIELYKNDPQGGRPFIASGNSADEILERLARLSKPYNTEIVIENGVGKIFI